jgi:hypothetical protein
MFFGERLRLRIIRLANAARGYPKVVCRVLESDVGFKQQPIRARSSERHSHTAGIHHPDPSNYSVELHVRMATDDHSHIETFEDGQEAFLRRKPGKNLVVIPPGGVAEQHRA